jgi:hypothetical protein
MFCQGIPILNKLRFHTLEGITKTVVIELAGFLFRKTLGKVMADQADIRYSSALFEVLSLVSAFLFFAFHAAFA